MPCHRSEDLDLNSPALVSACDELPLWSAPFGLLLLDTVRLGKGLRALDVGCGLGFPLLELAQRLGPTSCVEGLDPWEAALNRTREKIRQWGLTNVNLTVGVAEKMPFDSSSFDLIVSNNGLNNVNDLEQALSECARVARRGAQLVAAFNLPDTMRAFYDVLEAVLAERDPTAPARVHQHIASKRKTVEEHRHALERAGFQVARVITDQFTLRFTDGTTMFQHPLIRVAFLPPWRELAQGLDVDTVMTLVEERLNEAAHATGELRLDVPFACIECIYTHS